MASPTNPNPSPPYSNRPLYTRDILNDIEAKLADDDEYIELRNSAGRTTQSKNMNRGVGRRDWAPGTKGPGNVVAFQDERALRRLEERWPSATRSAFEDFFPVYHFTAMYRGANKTAAEARDTLAWVRQAFEGSEEAAALRALVKARLAGCRVDKVMAFGLGPLGFTWPGPAEEHSFYEHAAALVIREAVQEVSSAPGVALMVQDPMYTDVCRGVLGAAGVDVVEGFGAKGFALVDDATVVLAHHPNFPLREILADVARPAAVCMRAQVPESAARADQGFDLKADVDSARSRRWLAAYRGVRLPVSGQKAFFDNTWYFRDTTVDAEEMGGPASK
ncbi:hypothetical protein F5X98DRAFT_390273 [Xylaria grammica]|nr:hypothetical protein F5X98DRAFT_390273 [Xylaria grammica]